MIALLLLIAAPLLIGALLAPHALQLLEWLSGHFNLGPHFTNPPFRRVLSRCVMISALIVLYPAIRLSGIRCWRDIGWAPVVEGRWRVIGGWFIAGAISMGMAYLLSDIFGALYFRPRSTNLATIAAQWTFRLAGALIIGVLEETFFRGYLYSVLRRRMRLAGAVVLGGFLFAAIHFARPMEPAGFDPRHWAAGFHMLPHISDGIQPQYAAPMFVNLFLMGMLLCLLYDCFGTVYAVVGLHAGWVWMQGIGTYMFDRDGTTLWILFGPSETLSMTWAGTVMLAIFMAGALALHRDRENA